MHDYFRIFLEGGGGKHEWTDSLTDQPSNQLIGKPIKELAVRLPARKIGKLFHQQCSHSTEGVCFKVWVSHVTKRVACARDNGGGASLDFFNVFFWLSPPAPKGPDAPVPAVPAAPAAPILPECDPEQERQLVATRPSGDQTTLFQLKGIFIRKKFEYLSIRHFSGEGMGLST